MIIIDLKKKQQISRLNINHGEPVCRTNKLVASSKEWDNSIFTYNPNSPKLLPVSDYVITDLMKSYFYMFNHQLEKIKYRDLDFIAKKKSAFRIWISKPEIKHTNDKLTITLYVYNRPYYYFFNKAKNLNKNLFKNLLLKKAKLLQSKSLKLSFYFNNLNKALMNVIKKNVVKKYLAVKYIKRFSKKEILYMKYKQIMLFHKFKFNDIYLVKIKKLLNKIFRKNVELNIVSLKTHYLNSDILSQIVAHKLRDTRKIKAIKVLKESMRGITIPVLNKRTVKKISKAKYMQNLIFKNYLNNDYDDLTTFLSNNKTVTQDNVELEKNVLNNTKFKALTGIKLKASGRLTRRITAERAIIKFRSVGTLKNLDSSYKELPSYMVRGIKKSNLEKAFISSKTHAGAFGLKGWVSSY